MDNGIKSDSRVNEFGEVYTPEHIVKSMLDLIKEESYNISKKILEPSCGNGNFLVEILGRKLDTVKTGSGGHQELYDVNLAYAVSCVYGVDIIPDNIKESKERMKTIIRERYQQDNGVEIQDDLMKVVSYIMNRNIILGDTLKNVKLEKIRTRKAIAKHQVEETEDAGELMFSEWTFQGVEVTRREYLASNLEYMCYEYDKVNYMELPEQADQGLDEY